MHISKNHCWSIEALAADYDQVRPMKLIPLPITRVAAVERMKVWSVALSNDHSAFAADVRERDSCNRCSS